MTGMLFPKMENKKKRKKHKKSILQPEGGRYCYLCMMEDNFREYPILHEHHVFPGTAGRKKSEEYGLKVRLCPRHHEYSKEAVHENQENMRKLQRIAQEKMEQNMTREEFIQKFGRSVL